MPSKGENNLTIAEAKNYFEKYIKLDNSLKRKVMSSGSIGSHASEILFEKKQAIWARAYQKMISTGSAVKIPIDFDGTDLVVNKRTKATMPMSTLNYLFMYKDSLQQIKAEWVYLHPDSAWLFGDRAKYTGKIIIKDWNGDIKRGFVYEKNREPYLWSQKSLKLQKTASLFSGGKVATTYGDPNSPDCVDMSFYQADNCPCVGHTWSQRANCGCYIKPVNGVELVEVISCPPFDDTPNPSVGSNGSGQTPNADGTGVGSTPHPTDYTPTPCTNAPQVVNADGSMSPAPCIPPPFYPPTQNPSNGELTPSQFLISILGIQPTDVNILNFIGSVNNELILNEMVGYIVANGNTPENRDFLYWALDKSASSNLSFGHLEGIYEIQRNQNYTPRDREPASYYWRTKLSDSYGNDDFASYLTETTPYFVYPNGQKTINLEAFNCHYYAFGLTYASRIDPDYPKWVLNLKIESKDWEVVTGNVQVGDKVIYQINNNGNLGFTHSAIVTEVDADGYATRVKSKMSTFEIIEHHPRDIPVSYGSSNPTFTLNIPALGNVPAHVETHQSRIYWRKK